MRGGLAFHGRICGYDQFPDLTLAKALHQLVKSELTRANAVERTEPPLQHEIMAPETRRLFNGQPIRW